MNSEQTLLQMLPNTPRCTFPSVLARRPLSTDLRQTWSTSNIRTLVSQNISCPVTPRHNWRPSPVRTCHSSDLDTAHPRAWSHSRTRSPSRALSYPRWSHRAGLCHPLDKGTSRTLSPCMYRTTRGLPCQSLYTSTSLPGSVTAHGWP